MNRAIPDVITDQGQVETVYIYVSETVNRVVSDVMSDQGPAETVCIYVGETVQDRL